MYLPFLVPSFVKQALKMREVLGRFRTTIAGSGMDRGGMTYDPENESEATARMDLLTRRTKFLGRMAGTGSDLSSHLLIKDPNAVLPPITLSLLDSTLRELFKGMAIAPGGMETALVQALADEDTMRLYVEQSATALPGTD